MNKTKVVISELAFYGIRVNENGECFSFMEGQKDPVRSTCLDKISQLKYEIGENKEAVKQFWNRLHKFLLSPQRSQTGGSIPTEKMFTVSIKHLLRFAKKYRFFNHDIRLIRSMLHQDIKSFSEIYMSQIIDYKICIDWLDHLVRQGEYCVDLLSFYEQHRNINMAVTAQQLVPDGTMDMEGDEHDPLKERRWKWEDNDMKDDVRPINMETILGNDPEWQSEGFYWWEPQQEPYLYGDDENDPYEHTHYYNFKSRKNRNLDR